MKQVKLSCIFFTNCSEVVLLFWVLFVSYESLDVVVVGGGGLLSTIH